MRMNDHRQLAASYASPKRRVAVRENEGRILEVPVHVSPDASPQQNLNDPFGGRGALFPATTAWAPSGHLSNFIAPKAVGHKFGHGAFAHCYCPQFGMFAALLRT